MNIFLIKNDMSYDNSIKMNDGVIARDVRAVEIFCFIKSFCVALFSRKM